jgi:hypothetical protein
MVADKPPKTPPLLPGVLVALTPTNLLLIALELEFSQSIAQRKVLSISTFNNDKPGPMKLII